jgi:hypothetical protein
MEKMQARMEKKLARLQKKLDKRTAKMATKAKDVTPATKTTDDLKMLGTSSATWTPLALM